MSDSPQNKSRRDALKLVLTGAAAIPLSNLLVANPSWAGDLPQVAEDDPAAKGLAYVHDATKSTNAKRKPDQFCKNCNLIRSDSGEWRPCAIFPGKSVHENGWCTAWVLKS